MAIRTLGNWIPGVINYSGSKRSPAENCEITQIYAELGLKVQAAMRRWSFR
jgi:hypothetical protein